MNTRARQLIKWCTAGGVGILCIVGLAALSRSSSADISPLQTVIRGQSEWLAGGPASLRVIVTDHTTGRPVGGSVRISLAPADQRAEGARPLYTGSLRGGTLAASFPVPEVKPGGYELLVRVQTALGTDDITRPVTVRREDQILLTTDKPLYQPGQTIHLRALALRRPSLKPAAGTPLTLEVEDAKGNKVFKKTAPCSAYGIAFADFALADEISFGTYTVRAVMETGRAERTVEVKKYVLPKFKVSAKTDEPYYLPGQRMTGTVQADYFFGKPTSQADVLITLSTFDVGFHEVGEIKGATDANGAFKFETDLPEYFAGLPLEQGNAFVKMDVEVTDRAEHTEKITQTVPVAKDALIITAVPEAGEVKAGLDNVVYLLVSTPDGKPVAGATVRAAAGIEGTQLGLDSRGETDAAGVFRAIVAGRAGRTSTLDIEVRTPSADIVRKRVKFAASQGSALLLRADKAIAKVGDTVSFSVISTKQKGATYIDVIRDRQTIATRAVDLAGGKAEFRLPLTQDMQGTLQVHAYQILPDENIIRDTRMLYVAPANDLVVEVRADKETYRPGQGATLRFAVRDQQGKPAQAALGLTIVDESVFALQEMQPGLERVYFALEKELLQPRYEIHGFTPEGVVGGTLPFASEARDDAARQQAAKVLFAAARPREEQYSLSVDSYQERYEKALEGWRKEMARHAEEIDRGLKRYYQKHHMYLLESAGIKTLVDEGLLKRTYLRDRWGHAYRVHWNQVQCWLESAGPDGKWGTPDDIGGVGQWEREGRVTLGAGGGRGFGGAGGGMGGGGRLAEEQNELLAVAAPMAARAEKAADRAAAPPGPAAQPQVRLRQFFPETMYVNPSLITDERGQATATVEMADSITTWRLQALASSRQGQLGSASKGMRVFQDFFVDIDLPIALTQSDEISIPIAVYNYLPGAQTVRLTLAAEPWFELVQDQAEKSLDLAASDIKVVYFRIKAKQIGMHALTVHAAGSQLSDAIKRQIEVLPDGEERRDTWNDRLDKTIEKAVTIPKEAIPDASTILVKIYPGLLSQAVEGLDSLLRMPFGCFEQTSSVTYPNVLVMDYLKSTKAAKPDIQMKAEQYINAGYQRLLAFEVKGGGFSWFGDAPANQVLTAYGLLEFHDMSRVHEVDENVISRTQHWLASKQRPDGTWLPDAGGIQEGIIDRQQGALRTTAYIAWALAESGYKGGALEKAFAYLDEHWREAKDPYALAVIANAYLSGKPGAKAASDAIDALADLAVVEGETAYWKSGEETFTSARGKNADLETTALAAYALVKSERHAELTNKAITSLIRAKDSYGTWQTTQATVWALKTLLASLQRAAQQIDATVRVEVNGQPAGSFRITQDDYEVVRQVDAKQLIRAGENDVRIALDGKGSALYQIVAKYYLPWTLVKEPPQEALSIDVDYDRTTLAANDTITATARVVNNTPRTANMVVIDLGLAPGFDVLPEDFQKLVDAGAIKKFTLAARQVIVYLDKLAPKQPLELRYRMRAKFPLRAATPASRAYEYYNPDVKATAKPVELTVK